MKRLIRHYGKRVKKCYGYVDNKGVFLKVFFDPLGSDNKSKKLFVGEFEGVVELFLKKKGYYLVKTSGGLK